MGYEDAAYSALEEIPSTKPELIAYVDLKKKSGSEYEKVLAKFYYKNKPYVFEKKSNSVLVESHKTFEATTSLEDLNAYVFAKLEHLRSKLPVWKR